MRWIIGDVHGMLKPLEAIVNEIHRTDPRAWLYFVGDYVNRGPESRGVVDLLLTLQNAKFIRGNHDDLLDQILEMHVEQCQSAEEIIAQGFDEATVRRVLRLVRMAEFKRKQAAPVLKVTSRAFGTGWRMPIVRGE